MPALDDRLLPVFARQHWLVSAEDVAAAGGSRQQIRDRLQAGRWERLDTGVYRLVGIPTTWHQRLLAPILSGGPARVRATHLASAALYGVPGFGRGVPEVSTVRGYNVRRPGLRVHTSTDLTRSGIAVVEGVPTTDFGRMILDLARTTGDHRLLRAIEFGRRSRLVTWSDLASTLARHARRGRPGIRRLRRVLAANMHRDEVTDSDFELLVLALLLEHDLPEPVIHHKVWDGDRFVAELDLAYPQLKIAMEPRGPVHLLEEVSDRDVARRNDLTLLGWSVLEITWNRYVDKPHNFVDEVRTARTNALSPPTTG